MMPFGRSDAGLISPSVYRASAVQRMRTLSRVQRVVSTIIYWRSHASSISGGFGANSVNSSPGSRTTTSFPIVTAMPSAVCIVSARRSPRMNHATHTGPLPRSMVLPSSSEFSPSYIKLGAGMLTPHHFRRSQQEIKCQLWQAGRCLTRERADATACTEPVTSDASIQGGPRNSVGDLARIRRRLRRHMRASSFEILPSVLCPSNAKRCQRTASGNGGRAPCFAAK
jgi:hypothetical protein